MKKMDMTINKELERNTVLNLLVSKRQLVIDTISALLILLFVYTGISKFDSINGLKTVLKDYPLIGEISSLVAWGLPTIELAVATLLIIPRTRLWGLFFSLLLMSAFTIYLFYMLVFTPNMPCTCGGMLQKLSWPQHLIFNLMFVFLSSLAIWLHKSKRITDLN